MALSNILSKQNVENGLQAKHNKEHRFSIRRSKTGEGLFQYWLENTSKQECLVIPREVFDHFRSHICQIHDQFLSRESNEQEVEVDQKMFFDERDLYSFRNANDDANRIVIKELIKQNGSTGHLTIHCEALKTLISLLFHPKLGHPNDIFDRIVRYHKLFQFSFNEGSESITSGLTLRHDVLSQIEEYIPALASKHNEANQIDWGGDSVDFQAKTSEADEEPKKSAAFKSKLGQRGEQQGYNVNYEELFSSKLREAVRKAPKAADDQTKRGSTEFSTSFPLPLFATDIKAFLKTPFRCELSKDDVISLRENFLQDRESELFLGFEIIDAIYRSSGKLKTYRFPLYYMKVSIEESGRFIFIHPGQSGEILLNHLALATLVESFSPSKGVDPVEKFFTTLLSQRIDIDNQLCGMRIQRFLPFKEDVFDRTREVLLGLPDENGKGGLLSDLKLLGIECDLESVALYKSAKNASPVARALDIDLKKIQEVAYENPKKFYSSLLGQFLTPDLIQDKPEQLRFVDEPMNPGALPKSTRKLFHKLNENDVVLLEGPPGTGKTFTIMNLFIHCVNTDKRLLIVSDQKAAIHALVEKLTEFLCGREGDSPNYRERLRLFQSSVKVMDEVPNSSPNLKSWMGQLTQMLKLDDIPDLESSSQQAQEFEKDIHSLDQKISGLHEKVQKIVENQQPDVAAEGSIAPKHSHPTTTEDIEDFVSFLEFVGAGRHGGRNQPPYYRTNQMLLQTFLNDRHFLKSREELISCYDEFYVPTEGVEERLKDLEELYLLLDDLISNKPRSYAEFSTIMAERSDSPMVQLIFEDWELQFANQESKSKRLLAKLSSYISHPSFKLWQRLAKMLSNQIKLSQAILDFAEPDRILRQFQGIHKALHPSNKKPESLALEIIKYTQSHEKDPASSIQSILVELSESSKKRDELIRQLYIQKLESIVKKLRHSDPKRGTDLLTTLINLLEALKDAKSIEHGPGVAILKDFQQKLWEAFPIWICRKQAVSFLFPSKERLFDLVIVDEAGQCRVDDALPLLYRGTKIMVVGDEKQTVLDKNSVIDDYLFKEFNLEQHLQRTQARGIKGGGSNIFSLVKSIKQAGVMLEEHYRCPPDIIRYSNEYVYGSNLKVMQWKHPQSPPAVVVDYSEKNAKSKKPTSGKFKGIEVDIIDRYLDYVAKTITKLEKQDGRRINMETDVALSYFLLKNEPYIKEVKAKFLQKLGRGTEVLDGAGAALQGKERDYIFYLWDCNKRNMASFRQGDDPDKRKGELNVLMSRPKKRAFHYLHPEFENLKHETATITDYLWKAWTRQSEQKKQSTYTPRTQRPGPQFRPWQRFSGALMFRILREVWQQRHQIDLAECLETQFSTEVGDPHNKVDLILLNPDARAPSLALVDLSAFERTPLASQEIIDYYFQIQRATPALKPLFVFLHELADERSPSFRLLERTLQDWLDERQSEVRKSV